MNTVIASRGSLDAGVAQLLCSLPVANVDMVALSVFRRGNQPQQCEVRAQACKDSGQAPIGTMALSEDCLEVAVKTGDFIKEVMRVVNQQKPELIVVQEEARRPGSLEGLAADGVRILGRSKANVLLMSSTCSVSTSARVVVGAVSQNRHNNADTKGLRQVLDLNRAEMVIVAVARPFSLPFSRGVASMRGYQSQAIREIWEEQAVEATAQAGLLADQLARDKTKPLYVGRTGLFAHEIGQVVRSDDTSLLCLLIDSIAGNWLNKSRLLEMLENVDLPVLLVPVA